MKLLRARNIVLIYHGGPVAVGEGVVACPFGGGHSSSRNLVSRACSFWGTIDLNNCYHDEYERR